MFDDEPSTTPPRIEQPVSTPTTPDRHNFGIFGPNLVSNDSSSSNLERSVRDWNDTPRPKAMKRVVQHSQFASPTSSSVGRQSTGSGASAGPATTNGSRSSASPPTALLAESRHTNASPMERAYQPWGEEEYEEEIGQMDENDELEFDDDVPPMSVDDNAPLQSEELVPTNASPMAQAEHQLTPQNEDDEDDSLWATGPEYVDPKRCLLPNRDQPRLNVERAQSLVPR
ncbi:hypothetical protein BKA62DRAFT_4 [Auriculariales sp. MPI-PUGE-AT-0066]|nr:hypothetical protein BKA62DRAFT_4 [Auriculariales sp. MPI-PUGE-AT-0066]